MDHINRSRPSLYSFLAGSQPLEEPSQGDRKPDQGRAATSIPAALTPAWREEEASCNGRSEVLVSIGLAVVFALGFDPLVRPRGPADLARAAVAALAARPLITHRARCGEFWRPSAIPVNHL